MITATMSDGSRHDEAEHRRAANRAVGVSAAGLAVTGLVELALALFTGSVALLGDALHNLSDVSTSAAVFLGFRVSKKPPTDRYSYGYDKAEDLAGLGVALVIWASAVFAGVESYRKLVGHTHTGHVYLGMAGAVLGIAGNQIVARYKLTVGTRINSNTLVADAKHSWLDALSSAGALVGLVLVALGYRWGDPIAGLAVTTFIVHVGWEVTTEIGRNLMDGIDPDTLDTARVAVIAVPGVRAATVRGRWAGRALTFDVDGDVDPALTIGQADRIGARVRDAVLAAVAEARDVRWSPRPSMQQTSSH
ncbi:MAG: cation diffusion facilitator family transporter [Mycobacteriales bacterium]